MAITYPLALPTVTGIRSVELRAVNAVAMSSSPFTFHTQVHAYPGQMWQADVTLPPMRRSKAEVWVAFLLALRGSYGTFLLRDPLNCNPRGTATAATITGTAGSNTVSATVAAGDTLLAGDYLQIGAGGAATLHKVLIDYTGTGAAADLEIWPAIRRDVTAQAAVLNDASGVFRLVTNETAWRWDEAAMYGITFSAREAI